tara:strand:- start:33054 stop:33353 length:300 start_codon:yes stop_codon:yes gene_type:complete
MFSDPIAAKQLAVSVIERAQLDMRAGDIEALEWLASKKAGKWFDMINIPQSSFLSRTDWSERALGLIQHDLIDELSPAVHAYKYLVDIKSVPPIPVDQT